jgi:hypothetical protein
MSRQLSRAAIAAATTVVFATVGAACMREGSAQAAVASTVTVADDTAKLARLLSVVRGVDPLLCEMVTRNVDMHGSWSQWGPLGGNPLEADSAGAALLTWIQQDHSDAAFVPRLRAALSDSDACVRRVAGAFLGRIDHSSAVAALLAALEDSRAETRYVAAIGLGLADKPAAVAPLVRRLKDDSPLVRRASAWALGSLEASAALVPLIDVLAHDVDARVRQAAAWALGQIDG